MPTFTCPECGTEFQLKANRAATLVKCPMCLREIQIRATSDRIPTMEQSEPFGALSDSPKGANFRSKPQSRVGLYVALGVGIPFLVAATIGLTLLGVWFLSKPANTNQAIQDSKTKPSAKLPETKLRVSVSGEVFVTTTRGDVKKAAGLRIYLTPVTQVLRANVKKSLAEADQILKEYDDNNRSLGKQYPVAVDVLSPEYKAREKALLAEMDVYLANSYWPRIEPLLDRAEKALRAGTVETVTDGDGRFKIDAPQGEYLLFSDTVKMLGEDLRWCNAVDARKTQVNLILNQASIVDNTLGGMETHRLLRSVGSKLGLR